MENILQTLGIDGKLFLSQVFNFVILLLVLKQFVYKPLLAMIKKRNERIQEGLDKAKEADVRLKEVDEIAKGRLRKADAESLNIIKNTQQRAEVLEGVLKSKAEEHQKELMAQIELHHKRQQEESRRIVLKEAFELVKQFLIKTVELNPKAIDEALIQKAVLEIKKDEN